MRKENSQKSINDGIDGCGEFAEDCWDHVHVRVHQPPPAQHGEEEDHGVGSPGHEPNTGGHCADFHQLLLSLPTTILQKISSYLSLDF